MVTADPPCVSGAFGAGAVDYGYESRSPRPCKNRRVWGTDAPAGGATTSAWRPMTPDGAGSRTKLTNFGLEVAVPRGVGTPGLAPYKVDQLWFRGGSPARGGDGGVGLRRS
ncbi:hypothetical protein GCM10009765_50120 [Fodinicola feengrottensis]|uniref:Uncharacterized protein n=1 Tax=Fodinicola feengrottensis TaxID=435914 RepID=A0ABN2HWP6_9ACTN